MRSTPIFRIVRVSRPERRTTHFHYDEGIGTKGRGFLAHKYRHVGQRPADDNSVSLSGQSWRGLDEAQWRGHGKGLH